MLAARGEYILFADADGGINNNLIINQLQNLQTFQN